MQKELPQPSIQKVADLISEHLAQPYIDKLDKITQQVEESLNITEGEDKPKAITNITLDLAKLPHDLIIKITQQVMDAKQKRAEQAKEAPQKKAKSKKKPTNER